MKHLPYLLFIVCFSHCFLSELPEDCTPDDTDFDFVWQKGTFLDDNSEEISLRTGGSSRIGPILYKDFILFNQGRDFYFLDKFTGEQVKILTIPFSSEFNMASLHENHYTIKGDFLIFEHIRTNSSSSTISFLKIRKLVVINLETEEYKTITISGRHNNIKSNWNESMFHNNIVVLGNDTLIGKHILIYHLEDKTTVKLDSTRIPAIESSKSPFVHIWQNSDGDTLVTYVTELLNEVNQLLTINLSNPSQNLARTFQEIGTLERDGHHLYVRTATELTKLDLLTYEEEWTISNLEGKKGDYFKLHVEGDMILDYVHPRFGFLEISLTQGYKELTAINSTTGAKIWNEEKIPMMLYFNKVGFFENHLYFVNENLSKINLDFGCNIWTSEHQANNNGFKPSNLDDFSTRESAQCVVIDESLGFLYTVQNNEIVCIRL